MVMSCRPVCSALWVLSHSLYVCYCVFFFSGPSVMIQIVESDFCENRVSFVMLMNWKWNVNLRERTETRDAQFRFTFETHFSHVSGINST